MKRVFAVLALSSMVAGCNCGTPPGTTPPMLSASPNPADFGMVTLGSSSTREVVVTNVGSVAAISATISGPFGTDTTGFMAMPGAPFTASLQFRPTAEGSATGSWTLKGSDGATLLTVALRGTGVAVSSCTDADGDGALANCAVATDCNDSNAAVHPGAAEVCNGVDDDCNPSTVESCPSDAGMDSGVPDAGQPCLCADDLTDCLSVAACVLDAGQPVCFNFGLPDRTSCTRTAQDGGAGLCQTSQCVECITAADCTALNASATVCDLVTCNAGRCESVRRHDSTTWKVDPPLTSEILISTAAQPLKAMWDGRDFQVAVYTFDGGASIHRVSPSGVVDPLPLRINPRALDVAFGGGRFLAVTEEAPNGASPFIHIDGTYFSWDGGVSAPGTVIQDFGSTNSPGDFYDPKVAGSLDGGFMVVAQSHQFLWAKFVLLPAGNGGELLTPRRPRYPTVMSAPNGFTLAAQDLINGMGRAEGGGGVFPLNGQGSVMFNYNPVMIPFNAPVNPPTPGACCVGGSRLASNGRTFLYAYAWDNVTGMLRPLDANLQPGADVNYLNDNRFWATGDSVEMHSDGENFLVVQLPTDQSLKILRVMPTGTILDTPPFAVSGTDALVESKPKLVSDWAGRNLLLYEKQEGMQRNAYVRLFTTCP